MSISTNNINYSFNTYRTMSISLTIHIFLFNRLQHIAGIEFIYTLQWYITNYSYPTSHKSFTIPNVTKTKTFNPPLKLTTFIQRFGFPITLAYFKQIYISLWAIHIDNIIDSFVKEIFTPKFIRGLNLPSDLIKGFISILVFLS